MAKKRSPQSNAAAKGVTLERASRLYRLLQMLDRGSQTRVNLARRLKLDVRGFYRDLELLRSAGIVLHLTEGRYALPERGNTALDGLPFPDPHLTLGEAMVLAKGRLTVHKKLKQQIDKIIKG